VTTQTEMLDSKSKPHSPEKAGGRIRWVICAILFGAIVLIYIHRNVVSVLKKSVFQDQLHWSDVDYAHTAVCFTAAYAIGMLFAGRILDRIGVRKGFIIAASFWTVIAMSHGLLSLVPAGGAFANSKFILQMGGLSVFSFCMMRVGLGMFEGAFFPASIRTVAEWFPKHERAFATGIFNAGSAVGAILSPLLVPIIAQHWGWPAAFYLAGGLGIVWLFFWITLYRDPENHPLLTKNELTYIRSDQEPRVKSIPWKNVIGYRQTVAFSIGKFMTDPIWWFYIFWLPGVLGSQFNLDLKHFGPPLVVVYLMADGGSVMGGWLSSFFLKQGWTVNKARKTAMLICAILVLPVVTVSHITSLWPAIFIIGLAAAAHQGWSANLFTLASDTAPRSAVGSIVGIGGMMGAVGSFIFQDFIGNVVKWTHGSYAVPFLISGSAYLSALLIIHLLNPALEPIQLRDEGAFTIE
jgi:ACS family hexuronate transporter-like MFS transporter